MSKVVELVTSVIEMDKELESLRVENKILKEATKVSMHKEPEKSSNVESGLTKIEEYALAIGKKELAKKVLYWGNPSVIAVRRGGDIEYTSFDKYADAFLNENNQHIPPMFSMFEIKEFIHTELTERYQAKCKEAYENLLKAEQEESEDEE